MKKTIYILLVTLITIKLAAFNLPVIKNDNKIEIKELKKTIIYPNPAKDFFYISTTDNLTVKNIIIYNIVGHKKLEKAPKKTFNNRNQINISKLAAGKYFVKLILSDNTQEMKHLIIL